MRGASVVAPEDGGDASLPFEDPAEGGPAVAAAGRTQAGADHLHGLVGDDGDGQVAPGPDGVAVVDGPQAGFGFGERKTASMSVRVMQVRHRTAPSRPVRSVRRQHLVADAFGAYEAEGEVPAVGAGTGATDEHDGTVTGRIPRQSQLLY